MSGMRLLTPGLAWGLIGLAGVVAVLAALGLACLVGRL